MHPPSLFARHEAAHAVVADYLNLPMIDISIVPGVVEGRAIGGCVHLADELETPERLIFAAVTALAARVETDRFNWTGEIPEFTYVIDEQFVRKIAESLDIPDNKYDEWRSVLLELTSSVLNVAWMKDAIEVVAYQLDLDKTIKPEEVHGLCEMCKDAFPAALREVQIDESFIERIQKLRVEIDNARAAPARSQVTALKVPDPNRL